MPGFEHDVITPFIPDVGAVNKIIPVITQPEGGDGRNEILLKKKDIILVNIDLL
jgi:hypothetical protein